jgi:hypothetical protein
VPFRLDALSLERGDAFTFVTDAGDLDILDHPAGSGGYDALARNAGCDGPRQLAGPRSVT